MHITCYLCWKTIAIAVFVIWLVYIKTRSHPNEDNDDNLEWNSMKKKFEALEKDHKDLMRYLTHEALELRDHVVQIQSGPSQHYESLRRRIQDNLIELSYFLTSSLNSLGLSGDVEPNVTGTIVEQIEKRKRSLVFDLELMPLVDGNQAWRRKTAAETSDLVQRRLYALQNPPNCTTARKVVCLVKKDCGFGCRIHHLVYCMIFAYATERTLILDYQGLKWKNIFRISDNCTVAYNAVAIKRYGENAEVFQEISIPYIDFLYEGSKRGFLPLSVPEDLALSVMRFNGDPASWWIGQIVMFLIKPCNELQRKIDDIVAKLDFQKPIVGVHVRRTDKVPLEADFHHIHEYMNHVRAYFDQLELRQTVPERRVYLATDDRSVLKEARSLYPDYTFVSDPSIADRASRNRVTSSALAGLLADVIMLSRTDYLVCTFSSQVGRLAYELMQTNRVDASNSFASLDDIYYFGGQNRHYRKAVMANNPKNQYILTDDKEINFEVGDMLNVAGNRRDGYGEGAHPMNGEIGLIPWFKTVDVLVTYPFPLYPKIGLPNWDTDTSNNFTTDYGLSRLLEKKPLLNEFHDGVPMPAFTENTH